jgi:hypothetical protein
MAANKAKRDRAEAKAAILQEKQIKAAEGASRARTEIKGLES